MYCMFVCMHGMLCYWNACKQVCVYVWNVCTVCSVCKVYNVCMCMHVCNISMYVCMM